MTINKWIIVLAHAFVGWALCFATMGIGMATMSLENALLVHAIAAPIIFSIISYIYFTKINFTSPTKTAIIFMGFVIMIDFIIVAMLINRSFDMFGSIIGTWLPFSLIFLSTYIIGNLVKRSVK
jgi:hypothetical protein